MSGRFDLNELHESGAVLPGDARERRRLLMRSALRILTTAVALFALYAFVPVPGRSGVGAILGMICGLVVFLIVVGWQIHSIVRADHPVVRALEVVAISLPLLIVVFSFVYVSVSRADRESFSEPLNHVDAVYFTVSTIATVGFGDIAASSNTTRILVTVQMLFNLALIAGLVRLVVLAARTGLRRRTAGAATPGTGGNEA